jgi:predicted membrane channel-forming protein YqfA (hemolysin III family)
MFKDLAMRVFLAHLVAFVVIAAGLAAINLWVAPHYPWFIWVLIGWGAAVATHALALLLRKTHRRERIFIDRKARGFAVHLFAYLATVLILFFVNLTVTPQVWWFYWVALGWGAGIIAHGWCAFGKRRRSVPQHAPATHEAKKAEAHSTKAKSPSKRSPRKPQSKSTKS